MSTSDLSAIGVLPELLAAGVSSFKVEGRMKDAAYVGVTTAVYREALDAAVADPEGYDVHPRGARGSSRASRAPSPRRTSRAATTRSAAAAAAGIAACSSAA